MQKIIIESLPTISGSTADGIALLPGISGNGFWYESNQLRQASNIGKELPVFWNHKTDTEIGKVVFSLDESIPVLKYKLTVTNPNYQLVEGLHRVSIDADARQLIKRCTSDNCFRVVDGLILEGISIVNQPSVIGSTLNVIRESLENWSSFQGKCEDCKIKESENDQVKILSDKVEQLETKLKEATTCKTCGKHKSFS